MALIIGLIYAVSAGLPLGWREGASGGSSAALSVVFAAGLRGTGAGLGAGLSVGVAVGLPAGLDVGLRSESDGGLVERVVGGLFVGLTVGLIAGVAAGLVGPPNTAERLSWSWAQARSKLRTVLAVTLFFEVIVGLPFVLHGSPAFGLSVGLVGGLGAWLVAGMRPGAIPLHATPNEGITRSIRNGAGLALLVCLVVGLAVGLVEAAMSGPASGLENGLRVGPAVGLISGLAYGLGAAAQHGLLRLLLWRCGAAPLRYVRWLNYAVQLRLLYRGTSGGYVFIHRMIQEHFAGFRSIDLGVSRGTDEQVMLSAPLKNTGRRPSPPDRNVDNKPRRYR
ncbi:hypothetical protein ACU610_21810 [Geodermatophilus sp. URMC 61]|uniref:hypothetical protein n=1 Tax=Geodermatophilus sp. URMC 61 TaxID=3423411 RepID=UPI00406D3031